MTHDGVGLPVFSDEFLVCMDLIETDDVYVLRQALRRLLTNIEYEPLLHPGWLRDVGDDLDHLLRLRAGKE